MDAGADSDAGSDADTGDGVGCGGMAAKVTSVFYTAT